MFLEVPVSFSTTEINLESLMLRLMMTFFFNSLQYQKHRVFNKKRGCLEQSIHVTFDENLPPISSVPEENDETPLDYEELAKAANDSYNSYADQTDQYNKSPKSSEDRSTTFRSIPLLDVFPSNVPIVNLEESELDSSYCDTTSAGSLEDEEDVLILVPPAQAAKATNAGSTSQVGSSRAPEPPLYAKK